MPAVSKAQRQAMAIAEHHPEKRGRGRGRGAVGVEQTRTVLHDDPRLGDPQLVDHAPDRLRGRIHGGGPPPGLRA